MKINLSFGEIGAREADTAAEIINSAADFIMENFFPEFEEADVIPDFELSEVCRDIETVSITVNPVWLKGYTH
jgi:hypothetical protein